MLSLTWKNMKIFHVHLEGCRLWGVAFSANLQTKKDNLDDTRNFLL